MITQTLLTRIILVLLSFSIIGIVHALGHFMLAKLFKARVDKFYLFLNPWFSLFKKKNENTEYGIGWLTIGGYVKFSESKDNEPISQPAWQRLIILLGGMTANLFLAFFIYVMLIWMTKENYLPTKNMTYGIAVDSLAESIGLRDGDMILAVNNAPVEDFRKIPSSIILREATSIQVARDGKPLDIDIPQGFIMKMIRTRSTLVDLRIPFEVGEVAPNSAAENAGFQKGDHLLTLNGNAAYYFHEFRKASQFYKNQTVPVQVLRNGDTVQLTARIPESGILGIMSSDPEKYFNFATRSHTFSEAIPAGFKKFKIISGGYLEQLLMTVAPGRVNTVESLGGFISIGNLFGSNWNFLAFWEWTALLSIILAFINTLPIPPLDGWYVLLLLFEIVTKRKPKEKIN